MESRHDANMSESVDPAFARNALIRCLERMDRGEELRHDGSLPQARSEDIFKSWQQGGAVVRFARHLSQLLRESIGSGATNNEMKTWIEIALARQVGLTDSLPSRIRTMELDRLAAIARSTVFSRFEAEAVDRVQYSAAIRATRELDSKLFLTPIGQIFLEMKGRDAIRWLLHVEAAQSFGPADPWHIGRETALELVQRPVWYYYWPDQEIEGLPDSWKSTWRLAALGLVKIRDDAGAETTELEVLPVGRQLLTEIAEEDESPMSVLAKSVLSDLTLSAAGNATGGAERITESVQSTAVAEATARHSRLVAHEIRNMLVPVKTSLNAFYREVLVSEQPAEVMSRRRDGIDRGIDSVFRFISQLVELSRFAATPPEPFDTLSAIRDAISTVEVEAGRRIEQVLPLTLPPVSGHRARVITALINVLRNAAQAVPTEAPFIRIEAEALEGASAVRILVEDNGPGVPESMRRAIFDEGFSLRGGSGLGLALVREVFEKEMRGLVACDASSLGGARFVIRVPATGTERS